MTSVKFTLNAFWLSEVHYASVIGEQASQTESALTAALAARLRSALVDFSTPVNMQAAIGGAREASLAGLHPLPPQGPAWPLSVRAMFSAIK